MVEITTSTTSRIVTGNTAAAPSIRRERSTTANATSSSRTSGRRPRTPLAISVRIHSDSGDTHTSEDGRTGQPLSTAE